jgi:hypothetical protein
VSAYVVQVVNRRRWYALPRERKAASNSWLKAK